MKKKRRQEWITYKQQRPTVNEGRQREDNGARTELLRLGWGIESRDLRPDALIHSIQSFTLPLTTAGILKYLLPTPSPHSRPIDYRVSDSYLPWLTPRKLTARCSSWWQQKGVGRLIDYPPAGWWLMEKETAVYHHYSLSVSFSWCIFLEPFSSEMHWDSQPLAWSFFYNGHGCCESPPIALSVWAVVCLFLYAV